MKRSVDRILFIAVVTTAIFLSRIAPAYADIPNFGGLFLVAGGALIAAILVVIGLVLFGVRIILRIRRKTLQEWIEGSGCEDGQGADRGGT